MFIVSLNIDLPAAGSDTLYQPINERLRLID
jgi:hypothetical protein